MAGSAKSKLRSAFAVSRHNRLRMSSSVARGRHWNQLTEGTADDASKFRLSSWNILAQDYADRCSHLYGHLASKKQLLNWPVRWTKISDEIKELNSDVLCLQEVQFSCYDSEVRPFLERLRYKCRYLQKRNLPDGSLIAFKEGIFKNVLTKEIHMWHPDKCPTGQIGLLVLLEHVKSGKMILVSTTHLVFNPYRGDWKLKQIMEILAEIYEILRNSRKKPAVVLCGDLNSQPHSSLVQFLLNKKFDLSGIRARDIAQQDYDFTSQYNYYGRRHSHVGRVEVDDEFLHSTGLQKNSTIDPTQNPLSESREAEPSSIITHQVDLDNAYEGAEGAKTAVTSDEAVHVDYILYGSDELTVLCRHELPSMPTPIPNEIDGSDHYSLSVEFKFKS